MDRLAISLRFRAARSHTTTNNPRALLTYLIDTGILKMNTSMPPALLEGIANMHVDPAQPDLTIICGARAFKVHRVVMCSASSVLARECESGFIVSEPIPAATRALTDPRNPTLVLLGTRSSTPIPLNA